MSAGDEITQAGFTALGTAAFSVPARFMAAFFQPSVSGWVGVFDTDNAGGVSAATQVAVIPVVAGQPITIDYSDPIVGGHQCTTGIFVAAITDPTTFTVGPALAEGTVAAIKGIQPP